MSPTVVLFKLKDSGIELKPIFGRRCHAKSSFVTRPVPKWFTRLSFSCAATLHYTDWILTTTQVEHCSRSAGMPTTDVQETFSSNEHRTSFSSSLSPARTPWCTFGYILLHRGQHGPSPAPWLTSRSTLPAALRSCQMTESSRSDQFARLSLLSRP